MNVNIHCSILNDIQLLRRYRPLHTELDCYVRVLCLELYPRRPNIGECVEWKSQLDVCGFLWYGINEILKSSRVGIVIIAAIALLVNISTPLLTTELTFGG